MSDLINASICVTDIPKSKIKMHENDKKYMNITVAKRREPDTYGNTYTVFMSQTKDEREARANRIYIGGGKGFDFTPAATTPESVDQMPVASDTDDLPF